MTRIILYHLSGDLFGTEWWRYYYRALWNSLISLGSRNKKKNILSLISLALNQLKFWGQGLLMQNRLNYIIHPQEVFVSVLSLDN